MFFSKLIIFLNIVECSINTRINTLSQNINSGTKEKSRKRAGSADPYEFTDDEDILEIFQPNPKRMKLDEGSNISGPFCRKNSSQKDRVSNIDLDPKISIEYSFDLDDFVKYLDGYSSNIQDMLDNEKTTETFGNEIIETVNEEEGGSTDLLYQAKCVDQSSDTIDIGSASQEDDCIFISETKPKGSSSSHTQKMSDRKDKEEFNPICSATKNILETNFYKNLYFTINRDIKNPSAEKDNYLKFEFTIKDKINENQTNNIHEFIRLFKKDTRNDFVGLYDYDALKNILSNKERWLQSKNSIGAHEIIYFLEISKEEDELFFKADKKTILEKSISLNNIFHQEMRNIFTIIRQHKIMVQILPEYCVFDILKNKDYFKESQNNIQKLSEYIKLFLFSTKIKMLNIYLSPNYLNFKDQMIPKPLFSFIFDFRKSILEKTKILWKEKFYMIYEKIHDLSFRYACHKIVDLSTHNYDILLETKQLIYNNTHSCTLRMLFVGNYKKNRSKYNTEEYNRLETEYYHEKNHQEFYVPCESEFRIFYNLYKSGKNDNHRFFNYINSSQEKTEDYLEKYYLYIQELRKINFYNDFFEKYDNQINSRKNYAINTGSKEIILAKPNNNNLCSKKIHKPDNGSEKGKTEIQKLRSLYRYKVNESIRVLQILYFYELQANK